MQQTEGWSGHGALAQPHTGGLNDDPIQLQIAVRKLVQDANKVRSHCAANAPIEHFNYIFIRFELLVLRHERVVDWSVSEFVLNDGDFLAVRRSQYVVE